MFRKFCALRLVIYNIVIHYHIVPYIQVTNGGFGMVLDGTPEAGDIAVSMLHWDVSNGVNRRAWSGHPLANSAISKTESTIPGYHLTRYNDADDASLSNI